MTTATWSTRVRHDSDVLFREWGAEFAAKLAAVGLVQTADTGQINWVTVVRTAINTTTGYEIWRFNDAQQGTAPIYIKFEYGTAGHASGPRFQMSVGSGTNGAGTLTGIVSTAAFVGHSASGAMTADTTFTSYMCCVAGFFGVAWKVASGAVGNGFVCRTPDSSGVASAIGAVVCQFCPQQNLSIVTQGLRFAATAAAYTQRTTQTLSMLGFHPQAFSSSILGAGNINVAVGWGAVPTPIPMVGLCGVLDGEVTLGTTFSCTLVGSTARTYIGLQSNVAFGPAAPAGVYPKAAMLWE